jgi:hypothetical protein
LVGVFGIAASEFVLETKRLASFHASPSFFHTSTTKNRRFGLTPIDGVLTALKLNHYSITGPRCENVPHGKAFPKVNLGHGIKSMSPGGDRHRILMM